MRFPFCVLLISTFMVAQSHAQAPRNDASAVVIDKQTRLTWQANPKHPFDFNAAVAYCATLDLGGKRDWRLPTTQELRTGFKVLPPGDGMSDGMTFMHWTAPETKSCCAMLVYRNPTTEFGSLEREKTWKPGRGVVGARCVRDDKS